MIYRKKQYYGEEEEKISTDISYIDRSTTLTDFLESEEEKIEANRNAFPQATATGTTFNVQDSSNLPIKSFELGGNTYQATTSIAGGDEYDSPSPDHPQPVQVVTGDNTLKVVGKNLFDKNNANWTKAFLKTNGAGQTGSAADYALMPSGYYMVKPNTTYYLSFEYGTSTNNVQQVLVSEYDINKTHIQRTNIKGISLTTHSNTAYLRISFYNFMNDDAFVSTDKTNPDLVIKNIQLEVGSTATTYEPYTSQTQLISLGDIELAKIGDYQDRIYKSGDKWYLEKYTGKETLNGDNSWSISAITGTVNTIRFRNYYGITSVVNNLSLCDKFINRTADMEAGDYECILISGRSYISINKSRMTGWSDDLTNSEKIDLFKTWLTTNNVLYYYALATPTTTEITDTTLIGQLENVLKMTTYKNNTNAFSIVASGNVEGELKVEYYQDLQTLINNLNNAILSLGNNV